ncbi:MAG: helix-turn-helix transcriptional regulator [Gammaproteobacteria bacterium]|nr:MAG: helix-turn-helix transcriptional regulator [Gammaproteobacteria bacterium]
MNLTLSEISAVLGVSKPTASALKNGKYPAAETVERYEALLKVVERAVSENNGAAGHDSICAACPRDDCTGCRLAELID